MSVLESDTTRIYGNVTFFVVQTSPVFESTSKKGNTKYWQMFILNHANEVYTQTEYWSLTQDGSESERVASTPKLIKGKNIGRSNETTPLQQAQSEMESTIKKQRDKGYSLLGEEIVALPLPMLALEFGKRKKALSLPCYMQPKLDGVRALFHSQLGFWSRQGKLFIPEVVNHLRFETGEDIYDGELILPPPYTFQQTVSAVKKFDPELSPKLEYWIYDLIRPEDFADRKMLLDIHFGAEDLPINVKLVHSAPIVLEEHILDRHGEFVQQGYEGSMLRNLRGGYLTGHRSENLLKLKDFVDDEFEIVDVVDGQAKEQGCAIFVCKTAEGKQFSVRPKGTVEERQQMFNNRLSLVGQKVTVRYQNLSDDGVPRFPVGIGIRDYE